MIFHITLACPACDGEGTVERVGRDATCYECLGDGYRVVCETFYENEADLRVDYPNITQLEKADEESPRR